MEGEASRQPNLGDYTVDAGRHIYVVRFRGIVDSAALRSTFTELYRNPKHGSGFGEVIDFTSAERVIADSDDLRYIASVGAAIPPEFRPRRVAVVVLTRYGFGMARAYTAWAEDQDIETRIFWGHERPLAYDWASAGAGPEQRMAQAHPPGRDG